MQSDVHIEGDVQYCHEFSKEILCICISIEWNFSGGSAVKNLPANERNTVQSLTWEDPLEKEMATHSSILAWEIPWTGELGGLQSMGLQKTQTWLSK